MTKKLLDFQASISDVQQINPLFSTCKVRVLYTGKNRNMSIITRDSVEKALPTLKNIPIIGEFSESKEDWKSHGGAIDLDSWDYIHTTKPYGVVPESATWEWEEVKGSDGTVREYLTIYGCYLWTGRYEEAYTVIDKGKGQSMEIEVIDGRWLEEEEMYQIDNFIFSALCILGDDVEPAFEDASVTAYSLDKDSFKKEFSIMMDELRLTLLEKEEGDSNMLKELLEKYSLTIEQLTEKGIKFDEISEENLEAKIIEVFGIDVSPKGDQEGEGEDGVEEVDFEARINELEAELKTANDTIDTLTSEVESLREFKLNVEKESHEKSVQDLFNNFQLNEEDVKDLDIHAFTIDEIEEKCYAILGRKLASKKNFSNKNKEESNIHLPVNNDIDDRNDSPYGDLFEKFGR